MEYRDSGEETKRKSGPRVGGEESVRKRTSGEQIEHERKMTEIRPKKKMLYCHLGAKTWVGQFERKTKFKTFFLSLKLHVWADISQFLML